jgi:hypothetical protein
LVESQILIWMADFKKLLNQGATGPVLYNFFCVIIVEYRNKLECFPLTFISTQCVGIPLEWSPHNGIHSGKLQPCLQMLDWGGVVWHRQMHLLTIHKN